MPLPVQDVERELTHTRRVRFEGYKRADGLWDIEAHLSDIKNHDYHLKTGVRRAGLQVVIVVLDVAEMRLDVPQPVGALVTLEAHAPRVRQLALDVLDRQWHGGGF